MNILENLKRIYQQESLTERRERMLPAALYGALIASTYILTLSFINVYTFPNLPLGMDWSRMLMMWIGYSLALAFFGAIATWFTEEYEGIVGGGLIVTLLLATAFLFSSNITSALTVQSLIMAFPLIGVDMLGAWGLRWASRSHLEIIHKEIPQLRRKKLARHILIIILIGLVPGVLGRMGPPAANAIGRLDELLQAAPNDTSVWTRLPLRQAPRLQEHFGVKYVIYARQSVLSASALDVTVKFADGYTLTCILPEENNITFITTCSE